jgi:hypothetical protein
MLSLGIGCGCLGSAHAAVCLRAPGVPPQLRPRFAAAATRAARPPRVTAGEKEFPKKATSKRPARADASSSDSDDPSAPPPPPPPRVLPNSPVPVRYQMAVARVNKQAAAESAKPNLMKRRQALEGQSFRQPSVSETEHRQQRAERAAEAARLSKKESKHFALSSLYGSNTPGAAQQMPKVMLVDGYNVAHVWEVTKPMIAAGEMERARDALVEALTSYSHANRVRVVVAFDAMGGTCRTTSGERPAAHWPPKPAPAGVSSAHASGVLASGGRRPHTRARPCPCLGRLRVAPYLVVR